MQNWQDVLKADPTEWLLEEDNPSVRYFTLTDIKEKAESTSEVQTAKKAIMHEGIVPKILAKMNSDGYWDTPASFYTAKYKGTVWQLITLAELGADPDDSRVKAACEFILKIASIKRAMASQWSKRRKPSGADQAVSFPA